MADTSIAPANPARWAIGPPMRLRITAIIAILVIWEGLGASGFVYPGVLPSWVAILASLTRFLASAAFWFDLSVTALEIGLALSIGAVLGILAGIALGMSRWVGAGLERYVHYLASTPKVVFLPLIFILFGIGPGSKVALAAFACSFPMALGTASAMRHIPPVYIRVAKGFGLSPWQMAWMIYLPSMLRPIVTGLRISLGIAFSACLVAEMKFSNIGLGSLMIGSYEHSRFADVYALLTVIIGFAVATNSLLDRLGRRLPDRDPR
jgi:NitT/TauT family transport system permease protein